MRIGLLLGWIFRFKWQYLGIRSIYRFSLFVIFLDLWIVFIDLKIRPSGLLLYGPLRWFIIGTLGMTKQSLINRLPKGLIGWHVSLRKRILIIIKSLMGVINGSISLKGWSNIFWLLRGQNSRYFDFRRHTLIFRQLILFYWSLKGQINCNLVFSESTLFPSTIWSSSGLYNQRGWIMI